MAISGTTTEPAALHEYVGMLGRESLFSEAELESIELDKHNKEGQMKFQLHVLVQPGYGPARRGLMDRILQKKRITNTPMKHKVNHKSWILVVVLIAVLIVYVTAFFIPRCNDITKLRKDLLAKQDFICLSAQTTAPAKAGRGAA